MIFSTNYVTTHKGIQLSFRKSNKSFMGLRRSIANIELREWSRKTNSSATLALAEIIKFSESYPADFQESDEILTIAWNLLAKLSNNSLKALGLPENPPYVFSLEMKGSLLTSNFKILPRWGDPSNPRRTTQDGAFLKDGATGFKFVIPDPVFSIINLINRQNTTAGGDVSERMRLCAEIIAQVDIQSHSDEIISQERRAVKLEGALAN